MVYFGSHTCRSAPILLNFNRKADDVIWIDQLQSEADGERVRLYNFYSGTGILLDLMCAEVIRIRKTPYTLFIHQKPMTSACRRNCSINMPFGAAGRSSAFAVQPVSMKTLSSLFPPPFSCLRYLYEAECAETIVSKLGLVSNYSLFRYLTELGVAPSEVHLFEG